MLLATKKVSGITIAINADTSGVTTGLKDITNESIALTKQLKTVDNLLKLDPSNIDLISTKQELLGKSIDTTRKRLEALKGAQEDVKRAVANGSIGTEEYLAFQKELVNTERRLNDLQREAGTTGSALKDRLAKGFELVKSATDIAYSALGKAGDALKNSIAKGAELAKEALDATISAIGRASEAALNFAKDSVSTGMDFDKSISQIAATLGYSVDQMADSTSEAAQSMDMIREKAKEMGSETSFTAKEAADALNILAMSGYDAEESCSMVSDVLDLAAAGSIGLAESAKYTSGAMKGFADDTKDAAYYTDIIAKGATLANTNVNDLGSALSAGAATAAAYGQSAEGLTVSLLRMAEQGVTGETAVTGINRAMADLYTASGAAKDELDKLGVSAYDVATGSARDFNDIIDDLNAALAGMSDEEANAIKNTIFTTNGLNAFNKMTVTSTDKVNAWSEALSDATGSASEQAQTMKDNLAGDIDTFSSALEGLKITVSDMITPYLRDAVKEGTKWLGNLKDYYDIFRSNGIGQAIKAFQWDFAPIQEMVDDILQKAPEMAKQIGESAPQIIGDFLIKLTDPEAKGRYLQAGFDIINGLIEGLLSDESIDAFLEKAPEIIDNMVNGFVSFLTGPEQDGEGGIFGLAKNIVVKIGDYFADEKNRENFKQAAIKIIRSLVSGMISILQNGVAPLMVELARTWAEIFVGDIDYDATALDILERLGKAFIHNFTHSSFNLGSMAYDLIHGDGETDSEEHYARGGIITAPTRAMIGENGAEVVLPLENNTGWMDVLAQKIGGGSGITIGSINVTVSGIDGARDVGNEIVRRIDEALRTYQIGQTRGTGGTTWRT